MAQFAGPHRAPLRHPLARRAASALSLGAAVWLGAPPSHAAAPGSGDSAAGVNYQPPPVARRGGFTMGLDVSMGLAGYNGYPNEVVALDNPAYYQSTGVTGGSSMTLWFGGALRDWLSFGLGFRSQATTSDDPQGVAQAFLLRLEGFPAYSLGGAFRDLGVHGEFGTGVSLLQQDDVDVADGGSLAHIGFGAFYEPFQFWQMSTGPSLAFTHDFSQTMKVTTFSLGWRMVFYGIQPKT